MPLRTDSFYSQIPPFKELRDLSHPQHFRSAPQDWYLVLTDVRGSTDAIAKGRYKDVNMMGAACIAVVQAEFLNQDFPFVFGGDGATFLIPSQKIEAVKLQLRRFKQVAETMFNLDLRVGVISISEIYQAGQKIEVARHALGSAKHIAFFRGGGLAWAESKIKKNSDAYCLNAEATYDADNLTNLSCRWQPIKAKRGIVLSILVQPRPVDATAKINRILEQISAFIPDLDKLSPVQSDMNYRSLPSIIKAEWPILKSQTPKLGFKRFIEIFICIFAFKLKLPISENLIRYRESLVDHSDYKKFDDMLRLVIDCTHSEVQKLKDLLRQHHSAGDIFYGIHESNHALMTCLVQNISPGGHIHFIDGSDGGYTLAAQMLKKQILVSQT